MNADSTTERRLLFLAGAEVVSHALWHPDVAAQWDAPSVLEEQSVGSLAGHLARGGVWVVEDYLDREVDPELPVFGSASEYFAYHAQNSSDAHHEAIRERGRQVAEKGLEMINNRITESLASLKSRLAAEPARMIPVAGGAMMIDDYLLTRLVEQTVHLDDLARSVDADPWPIPAQIEAEVLACGAEVGRLRWGGREMVRAMFRHPSSRPDEAPILPVM